METKLGGSFKLNGTSEYVIKIKSTSDNKIVFKIASSESF